MEKRASAVAARPGAFRRAIASADRVNVIAECKRRSPSRGVLKADYDPVAIARGYEAHGAAAISVLTEPTFFDGSLEHLAAVRQAVKVPIIRKDFIVDPYQILEARAVGADAILLIVAALSPAGTERAARAGDGRRARRARRGARPRRASGGAGCGRRIIGVNNRNLRTLAVSTDVSEQFMDRLPKDVVAVAESGLKTSADLLRLRKAATTRSSSASGS